MSAKVRPAASSAQRQSAATVRKRLYVVTHSGEAHGEHRVAGVVHHDGQGVRGVEEVLRRPAIGVPLELRVATAVWKPATLKKNGSFHLD